MEKGAFWSPLTTVANFTYLYVYARMCELVGFYGILTLVGYLIPNLVHSARAVKYIDCISAEG